MNFNQNQQQRIFAKIKSITFVETKEYKDSYLRPYEVKPGYEDIGRIQEVVHNSVVNNRTSKSVIETMISKATPNMLSPSANVLGVAPIVNNWGTRRFKVTIIAEFSYPGSNTTTINVVQGYTNYMGMTVRGTLDEHNMDIYINSINVLTKVYNPNNNAMNIIPIGSFKVAQDEVNLGNSNLVLARPDDLLSTMSILKSTSANTMHVSNLSKVNDAQLVDSTTLSPLGHVSSTISAAIDEKIMADVDMTAFGEAGNGDVYDGIVGTLISTTPGEIEFFKLLYKHKGLNAKSFTIKDLEMLDPMSRNLDVNVYTKTDLERSLTNLPPKFLTEDTADTYDSSFETRIRLVIHEVTESILAEVNLDSISFSINNLNGEIEYLAFNGTSLIEGYNTAMAEEIFMKKFIAKAWPIITNNNMSRAKIEVVHQVIDITIIVSVDFKPDIIYRDPIFADAKNMPLLMDQNSQSIMAETYGDIVETTINTVGSVVRKNNSNITNQMNNMMDNLGFN